MRCFLQCSRGVNLFLSRCCGFRGSHLTQPLQRSKYSVGFGGPKTHHHSGYRLEAWRIEAGTPDDWGPHQSQSLAYMRKVSSSTCRFEGPKRHLLSPSWLSAPKRNYWTVTSAKRRPNPNCVLGAASLGSVLMTTMTYWVCVGAASGIVSSGDVKLLVPTSLAPSIAGRSLV